MNLTTLLAAFLAGGLAGFLLANLGWAHSNDRDRGGERTAQQTREDGVRVSTLGVTHPVHKRRDQAPSTEGASFITGPTTGESDMDDEDRTAAMWALERELEDEP